MKKIMNTEGTKIWAMETNEKYIGDITVVYGTNHDYNEIRKKKLA
jgi:hypothetical protein